MCVYLCLCDPYTYTHLLVCILSLAAKQWPLSASSADEFMSVERTFTQLYCFAKQTQMLVLYENFMDRRTFIKSIDLAGVAKALTLTLPPIHCLYNVS